MKLSKASQFRKRVHPGSFFPFPWPQALSASPLGIWAVCSFWVNSTGMPNLGAGAQARVSAWWAQESEQSSLHSTPSPAQSGLSHAVQVSMWRGTEAWFLLSPPFFFFCFICWGCWHLLFIIEATSTLWYTNLTKCGGCCVWECDNPWNVQEKEGGKANTMSRIFYKTEGDPS